VEVTHETTAAHNFRIGVTVVGVEQKPLIGDLDGQALTLKFHRGILLRCPGSSSEVLGNAAVNTHSIWVGIKGVTKDTGMAIPPGASLTIPIDDPSVLWIISTTSAQRVVWMSL
jgi:hypothetical protein